ncbi:MAG: hypothetical protein K0U98_06960 [Deltaproteobacteria bacterium]|nr:hypothetical protein [Deltaproteobacteria bacterium]
MEKTKFGTIVLSINVLATFVLLATALQGSKRVLFGLDSLHLHVLLSLAAALGIFFAHTWVAIYLVSLNREMRRFISENGLTSRARDLLVPPAFLGWSLALLLVLLVTFFLGPAVLLGKAPSWSHTTAFWLTLAVQLWSLGVEFRALRVCKENLIQLNRTPV